jgi:F420-non-reducing hydrogenase iron-sulfur subunit
VNLISIRRKPNQPAAGGREPRVVAYACTYCAYTAADLAGSMRLHYSPCVRIVKIPCTGRIDAIVLLKAFEGGADVVYVAGCALGNCHFLQGNVRALGMVRFAKKLLAEVGVEPERLEFFHIPASAGPLFAERADQMVTRARELGPTQLGTFRQASRGGALDREPDAKPQFPSARLGILVRGEQEQEKSNDRR